MNPEIRDKRQCLESLVGRVADEFTECLNRGERPDVETYAQRYPEIATILRQALPALQAVGSLAPGVRSQESGVNNPQLLTPDSWFLTPESLGDFRIIREIGRGGMGVVYEAEQISLGRRVALKVLPFAATLDPRSLQRFKNEAQAAAHLQHQNIVPVHAVACERGVHYYAMQFVDGHTLAALIQELRQSEGREDRGSPEDRGSKMEDGESQKPASQSDLARTGPYTSKDRAARPESSKGALSSIGHPATPFEDSGRATEEGTAVNDRAAATETASLTPRSSILDSRSSDFFRTVAGLGIQAAEALEHAHQLGVIHRDIKPANLMVDGRGNLWITDFGLAQCQGAVELTMSGDLLGTLRYMSPEQALAQRFLVDHRTDIYSLGATLYELLTLEPVFQGTDRQQLLRQIAFDEPRTPRRSNKAIPQELETIVLKTMEKSPSDRYATAKELANDLRSFLEDKPIKAKRATSWQRARRWARRHRPVIWSATVALLAVLAVLAGSIGWIVRDRAARQAKIAGDVQLALAEGQRLQREGKWPQALAAAERAMALLDNSGGSEQLRKTGGILLADLRMVARLESVRMLGTGVKEGHFDSEEADREYESAFREYGIDVETLDPAEVAERIRARTIRLPLATALDGWAQKRCWFPQKGRKAWRDLLALAQVIDPDPERMALRDAVLRGDRQALVERASADDIAFLPPETLILLADYLGQMGCLPEATSLLRRAQEQHRNDFWINHILAQLLVNARTPCWDEALPFYMAAVAIRPDSAGAHLNLGNALTHIGRKEAALVAFRKALDLKPDYAEAHCNVGWVLWEMGRHDEGIGALRHAIALKPDVAEAHGNLGFALWKKGQYREAVAAFRRTVELKPKWTIDHYYLGGVLLDMGRFDEAAAACRRAIDLKPDYAEAHSNLGAALYGKSCLDEAQIALERAIELRPALDMAHFILGHVFLKKGQLDEAVAAYGRAIDLNPNWPMAHYDLGNTFLKMRRLEEAVDEFRRAIALKPDYAEAHCNLGAALRQQGDFPAAFAAYQRGHELGSRRPGWLYLSAQWVKECQRLVELDGREADVMQGRKHPANAAEKNEYAQLCYCKRYYLAAVHLWVDAFTADSNLAEDLRAGHRNEAAYAASLAAAGQGLGTGQLSDDDRVHLRKQTLNWLTAELKACGQQWENGQPEDRLIIRQRLESWQSDSDLAGLRHPAAVAKLTPEERDTCRRLWAEVQAFLTKANAASPGE